MYIYCLDYIKSMASLDICRQIVATLEREKNSLGRLSHASFKVCKMVNVELHPHGIAPIF